MTEPAADSPEAEIRFHTYRGHEIPFYVRIMWVGFYCLAIFYVIRYLFPSMQEEIAQRRSSSRVAAPAAASPEPK